MQSTWLGVAVAVVVVVLACFLLLRTEPVSNGVADSLERDVMSHLDS